MRELTLDELDEVSGGWMKYAVPAFSFIAGHIGSKLIDAFDRSMSSPGTSFEMTDGLRAVAGGNMGA